MTSLITTTVDLPSSAKARSRPSCPKPARDKTRRLSLALQGGGALGAFTWGVLDRLLEEEHITFDAVSGASAGASRGHERGPAGFRARSGRSRRGARQLGTVLAQGQQGWSTKPPGLVQCDPDRHSAAALAL